MAKARWEISSLQAGMLVAGSVALTGHALAVSYFLQAGGRDAWLAGLVAMFPMALSMWALVRLGRLFPGQSIVQYLPKILGYLGYAVAAVLVLYYLLVVVFTLRMTTDWLVESILPATPAWVLGLLYIGVVLYTASGGLDVLARVNQFILPLLIILGTVVSVSTMPAKDYRLLTPILRYGPGPLAAVTWLGLGYFGETAILAMFHPYVRTQDRPSSLRTYWLALVFVGVTMTGPLAGSIATLGYRTAANMAYPTFQHWLMINVSKAFERTDLLAVHQWLAGGYVRCGLFMLMAVTGIRQMGARRLKRSWLLWPLGLAVLAASQLLFATKSDFDLFVTAVYLPAGAILGVAMPPVLLAVAAVRQAIRPQGVQSQHG